MDSSKETRNNTAYVYYTNVLFPISEVLITSMSHSSAFEEDTMFPLKILIFSKKHLLLMLKTAE